MENTNINMDRRTFLLSLSGGALTVVAGSMLSGCGGGGDYGLGNGANSPGGAPATNFGLTLPSGQPATVNLMVQPNGTATGTLTVGAAAAGARPHVFPTLPPGTYNVTGTVNLSTKAFNLTATSPQPGAGQPLTLAGTLPTATTPGSYTATYGGSSQSGTIPPAGGSSSFSNSSLSSSSSGPFGFSSSSGMSGFSGTSGTSGSSGFSGTSASSGTSRSGGATGMSTRY